ncbi:MAG TPA: protein kinase [Myxococcota bacterium]|nr:protein kinase [Myxococcota bacterium]HQK49905.1 protein kinase [Myxococcota bacterium]
METRAVCPNCEHEVPAVGQPCLQPVCSARGYRGIPDPWFQAAKQWCQRKGRPLDPLLGRRLDRYLLAGKLGEGGMGAVYLALQEPLMREVALKLVSGLELNPASEARFEREARTISVLDHPNIVKLHDYGIGDLGFRVPYMALEYVRHGRTLRQVFPGDGPRDPSIGAAEIQAVFEQVLHALGAAHEQGIVHRDVKPENVMVAPVHGNPWFVKVLDFGLAKVLEHPSHLEVSRTGQPMGTPIYMAPEQAYGESLGPVDGRVDLYAVGVMIYEVFTGRSPFPGDTSLAILTRKVDPTWNPLAQPEARGLPEGIRSLLGRALRPRPQDRFSRAEEMLQALREAFRDLPRAAWQGYAPGTASSEDRPQTPSSPPREESLEALHDGRTLAGLPGVVPAAAPVPSPVPDHPEPGTSAPEEPPAPLLAVSRRSRSLRLRWIVLLLAGVAAVALLVTGLVRRAGVPDRTTAASTPATVQPSAGGTSKDDGSPGQSPAQAPDLPAGDLPEDRQAADVPGSPPDPGPGEPEAGTLARSRPVDAGQGGDRSSLDRTPPRKAPAVPRTLRPEVRRRPSPPPPDPSPEPPVRKFHLK